jgi:hypothetical protein
MKRPLAGCLILCWCTAATASCLAAGGEPQQQHGLHYTEPARVWDEAMPLGNGLLGALVWGDGRPLRISLDRTDRWDLRPVPEFESADYSYRTMRRWVSEGRIEDLRRLYEAPYRNPGPTKIPAGRIELMFDEECPFRDASLDLGHAVCAVRFGNSAAVRVLVHALGDHRRLAGTPFLAALALQHGSAVPRREGLSLDQAGRHVSGSGDGERP